MNTFAKNDLHPDRDMELSQDADNEPFLVLDKLAEMKQELGPSFLNVIQHFQSGILLRPEKINQAIQANDPERVERESHSLKSVCRQIGLVQMGHLAANLESLAHAGELRGAGLLVGQLIQAGQLAHSQLTEYCTSP
ncbi:MAG: Hpt domain-containing protein [Magnetococcales bacterium]|nr:Hpt domain-containing protein [Magnetococcales bacterium]